MSIQDWGAIGEVIGAAAVVVTLIYLSVQLRQNTASVRVSSYQQWLSLHHQTFSQTLDPTVASIIQKGSQDTRDLSEDTYVTFLIWFRMYFYMQHAQFLLYKRGVVEKEIWEGNLNDPVGTLRFPGVRQWWESGVKDHFTKEFVDVVEKAESHATMILWSKEKGFHPSPYHEAGSESKR